MTAPNNIDNSQAIAIVGMATRLPGANGLDAFWTLLSQGKEAIEAFDEAKLLAHGVDLQTIRDPNFVSAKGYLPDVDMFDATFFGFSPREAALVDPQHRVMMEVAWQAMEHSGYDPEQWSGRCAIFTSAGMNTYLTFNIATNPGLIEEVGGFQLSIYNDKDFVPTRIAYALNSHGPAIDIGTACSSSLVGVHLACQQLLAYQSDITLVGGVTIHLPQETGYIAQPGLAYSPDGHCRPFDATPSGLVDGNGAAAIVLKRLDDAIEDGDTIYAIIRSSAINNDGSDKVGYSAPSIQGQADVIREAQALAGVTADQISYVEAHGTATPLGDPVEVAGLTEAFRHSTAREGFCGLGSVKSNIGHVDKAAGLAGLIKTALALQHEAIPANLHWQSPNPKLNLAQSPFFIVDQLTGWPRDSITPRIAGISSFGVGGTNSHAILQEAPGVIDRPAAEESPQLLVWSAKTEQALQQIQARLLAHLTQNPNTRLTDMAYTLKVGRKRMNWRSSLVCHSVQEACQHLAEPVPAQMQSVAQRQAVFLFSGQGTQHAGMGQALYQNEPVYREVIDHCAEVLQPLVGCDLRTLLYPTSDSLALANESLKQTALAQPALFATEYALAQLWLQWGIKPVAVLGHSLGEYVAACVAGVFGLDDGLRLVAERGRLMQSMPTGAMLAVSLETATLSALLEQSHPALDMAAVNGASQCVVSGPLPAIEALQAELLEQSVMVRTLQTSHAFHSRMMEPMLAAFKKTLASVTLHAPSLPLVSNVTGHWADGADLLEADYWLDHIRKPVQFHDSLVCVAQSNANTVWIEIGPGRVLSSLAAPVTREHNTPAPLASLPPAQSTADAQRFLLASLGQWWALGGTFDATTRTGADQARRIALPTYPFERASYWIKPGVSPSTAAVSSRHDRQADPSNWFYHLGWQTQSLNSQLINPRIKQVLIAGQQALTDPLRHALRQAGCIVHDDVREMDQAPDLVIYLIDNEAEANQDTPYEHCKSLLSLSRQVLQKASNQRVHICVIGQQLLAVGPSEAQVPAKAALIGLLRTLPYEYTEIRCQAIDVASLADQQTLIRLSRQLVLECLQDEPSESVVLRTGGRWIPQLCNQTIHAASNLSPLNQGLIRGQVSYLVLGGLSDIGLVMVQSIIEAGASRVVLTCDESMPPSDEQHIRLDALRQNSGAEIEWVTLPIFDAQSITALIERTASVAFPLAGVIDATDMHAVKPTGLVQALDDDDLNIYWQQHRHHLHALGQALDPLAIDYCLVMSSLAAFIGGTGQLAGTVAGLYTQAFAQQHNQSHTTPWFVAQWDAWSATDRDAITPEEGGLAMRHLLSLDNPGLILVATRSPLAKREQILTTKTTSALNKSHDTAALHQRPRLSTPMLAPETTTQKVVADIWQRFLGIETIGLDDDFFELGGNSLLAAQLLLEMKSTFGVAIDLGQFFTATNVRILSDLVLATQIDGAEPDELLQQLDALDKLSDEEVQAMLDQGTLPEALMRQLSDDERP